MIDIPLVRRSPVPASLCNLAKSFELIGDRWTLLILRSALYGVRRFDDFQTDLEVPRSVLSHRLAGLVETGIMEQREYREGGQRARIEYRLSEMGKSLGLPFIAMTQWGDRWLSEGVPPPLALRSKSTRQKLTVAFVDERGRAVRADDLETVIVFKANRRRVGKPDNSSSRRKGKRSP